MGGDGEGLGGYEEKEGQRGRAMGRMEWKINENGK